MNSNSSNTGLIVLEFCSAYAASKFGPEGWMESLQAEAIATAEQKVKDLPEQINAASRYDQSGSGAQLDIL